MIPSAAARPSEARLKSNLFRISLTAAAAKIAKKASSKAIAGMPPSSTISMKSLCAWLRIAGEIPERLSAV